MYMPIHVRFLVLVNVIHSVCVCNSVGDVCTPRNVNCPSY